MPKPTKPAPPQLKASDIKVGRTYRAKRPQPVGLGEYNDRYVMWISPAGQQVQYDGPAVRDGSHYPTVSMEKFLAWVGSEVPAED